MKTSRLEKKEKNLLKENFNNARSVSGGGVIMINL